MNNRNQTRQSVVCEIDREIGATVLRIGDYCRWATDRNNIVSQTFCLLFVSLLLKDPVDALNGFERITQNMEVSEGFDATLLYGEFLGLLKIFKERYRHYKFLLAELSDILPDDLRANAEEVFDVEWSPYGDVLRIS